MALIKCVECGEHFSSKAKACPTCGCPVEVTIRSIRKKQAIQKNQIIEKYNILGYSFSIDIKTDRYIKIVMGIRSQKAGILNDGRKMYYDLGNIDNVIDKFPDQLAEILDMFLNSSIDILTSYGCYDYDKNRFFEKYSESLDTTTILQPIYENYLKIMECQEELNQYYEELRQARRNTWTGGGFGIKGALKGHIKAQMMNAGNSALHSIPDSINHSKDMAEIAKAKGELFRNENTINAILTSLEKIFDNTYEAVNKELENAGKIKRLQTNPSKASSIINNVIKKYNEDNIEESELTEQCANAFFEDPLSYKVIETILIAGIDSSGDLLRYAKKYGFYDEFKKEEQKDLREQNKDIINRVSYNLKLSIADNSDFLKVYNDCFELSEKKVEINDSINTLIKNRLKFPISETEKKEIVTCIKKYDNKFKTQYLKKYIEQLNASVSNTTDQEMVSEIICNICYSNKHSEINNSQYGNVGYIEYTKHFSDYRLYAQIPKSAKIFFFNASYSDTDKKPKQVIAITDKGLFFFCNSSDGEIVQAIKWKDFIDKTIINLETVLVGGKDTGIRDFKIHNMLDEIQKKLKQFYSNHQNGILHDKETDTATANDEVDFINSTYKNQPDEFEAFRNLLQKGIRTKTGKSIMAEKEQKLITSYTEHSKKLNQKNPISKVFILLIFYIIATIVWFTYIGDLKWYWNLIFGWCVLCCWCKFIVEDIKKINDFYAQTKESEAFVTKFKKYFSLSNNHIVLKK